MICGREVPVKILVGHHFASMSKFNKTYFREMRTAVKILVGASKNLKGMMRIRDLGLFACFDFTLLPFMCGS